MAFQDIKNIEIKGVSACVPKKAESNRDIDLLTADVAEKLIATIGVENRRIVDDKTTTSDLCLKAAEILIKDLGWQKDSIDYLIFVSQTPDYQLPATACILQEKLGISQECMAFDISAGCSGWVYGLTVLSSLLSNKVSKGLLLVGDTSSKICSTKDKSTYPLFGDAGTSTALESSDNIKSTIHSHLATDGSGAEAIIVEEGGARNKFKSTSFTIKKHEEGIERNGLQLALDGMNVFSFGINKAPESIEKLLLHTNIEKDSIDQFIFHQANLFMNEKIRKKLKLPIEKAPYSLKDYGNTSSASIPLTMVTQLKDQLTTSSLKIMACGFGVGLSWGSVIFNTNAIICPDLIEY